MREWIQTLIAALALGAAYPAAATVITGADGPLAPASDTTLPFRADGMFDFSSIDIGAGITLRFDAGMQNVTLLSLGDILIAGVIDASGINLALETQGQLVFTGSITANGISLTGGQGGGNGGKGASACLGVPPYSCDFRSPEGRLALPPGELEVLPGGDITIRAPGATVPEPGTVWLMALLPMLALFGRKRG